MCSNMRDPVLGTKGKWLLVTVIYYFVIFFNKLGSVKESKYRDTLKYRVKWKKNLQQQYNYTQNF